MNFSQWVGSSQKGRKVSTRQLEIHSAELGTIWRARLLVNHRSSAGISRPPTFCPAAGLEETGGCRGRPAGVVLDRDSAARSGICFEALLVLAAAAVMTVRLL